MVQQDERTQARRQAGQARSDVLPRSANGWQPVVRSRTRGAMQSAQHSHSRRKPAHASEETAAVRLVGVMMMHRGRKSCSNSEQQHHDVQRGHKSGSDQRTSRLSVHVQGPKPPACVAPRKAGYKGVEAVDGLRVEVPKCSPPSMRRLPAFGGSLSRQRARQIDSYTSSRRCQSSADEVACNRCDGRLRVRKRGGLDLVRELPPVSIRLRKHINHHLS